MKTKTNNRLRVLAFCLCVCMLSGMLLSALPVQATTVNEMTVYFLDTNGWGCPRIDVNYVLSSGKANFEDLMTLVAQNEEGQYIYQYTFDADAIDYILFEDHKTEDKTYTIELPENNTLYSCTASSEKDGYYTVTSVAYADVTVYPVEDITVYLTDNKNWGDAWIGFIYNSTGSESSIHQMTLVGQDADGFDVYSYTFNPVGVSRFGFYNGGEEATMTAIIDETVYSFANNSGYYCGFLLYSEGGFSAYSLGTYTYQGLNNGTTTQNNITVYFTNNKSWEEVWIAVSFGNGLYLDEKMEKLGTDADGLDVYSYSFDSTGIKGGAYFLNGSLLEGTYTEMAAAQVALGDGLGFYCGGVLQEGPPVLYNAGSYTFEGLDVGTTTSGNITVYFTNNKLWENIIFVAYDINGQPLFQEVMPMTYVGQDAAGLDVYSYSFDPTNAGILLFGGLLSDGSVAGTAQTFTLFENNSGFYCGGVYADSPYTTYVAAPYTFTDLTVSTTTDDMISVYFADVYGWGAPMAAVMYTSEMLQVMLDMVAVGTDADNNTVYRVTFSPEDAEYLLFASDIDGTFMSRPVTDFSNGAAYACTTVFSGDETSAQYNIDAFDFTPSAFENISVSLGEDISLIYYTATNVTAPQMRFTVNGYTVTVNGKLVNGQYQFVFDGVAPQWIGDTVTAELLVNGEVVATKEYSVLTYLNTILTKYADNTALCELVNKLIAYGAAAQDYTEHAGEVDLGDLVSGNDFAALDSTDTLVNNTESVIFESANLYFDSVNKLKFKFSTTADTDTLTFKVSINGGEATDIAYTANGDGSYTILTDAIYATGFDDVYTVTAYINGVADATLTYSVKSYVYSKQNATGSMAALAKALYNYGIAAQAYQAAN